MKTLHIIDHFSLGGAQRIVEGILNAVPGGMLMPLRKKGSPGGQLPVRDGQVFMPPRGGMVRQMLRLLRAPGRISEAGFEIVHCHLPSSWWFGLWLNAVLPARRRPKLIFHEHDSVRLERWYYGRLVRAARRAGTLVAVSQYIQLAIANHGIPTEEIFLLQNFVDLERFQPGSKPPAERFGLRPEQVSGCRLVGFAGRLVEYKGWQFIVAAADRLRQDNVRFLVAGTGPDMDRMKESIRTLRLEHIVLPLGFVEDMPALYRLIDVLMIASERESFGLVQLEAQASGVPVVIFENQAARELAGDHSTRLVMYGDSAGMADGIRQLLEHPAEYERLAQRGLENARRYGLPAYLDKLEALYAHVLAGGAP